MNTDELSAELTAALERLATLPGRPAGEHLEAFEQVHSLLEESLRDLAADPGPGAVPGPGGSPGPGGVRAPR
ncbi:hypothetical protein UG55_1006328 [Frankia sp. EI5c]|uniref:hypothetical protein n=1 Tax=Frankia sp. EI5c TaxID=683316 RepID=UPI0007C20FF8|nr:hypothetical protein [Frankia sp. EI5c]OAA28353.1 hypothetical protein UG55_1006328 [Frankia sp. EI5c]